MSVISYTSAAVIGVFMECVVYGIFVSLLAGTCYVQWRKFQAGRGVNHLIAFATAFFGFTVTAHLVISIRHVMLPILSTPPGAKVHLPIGLPLPGDTIAVLVLTTLQVTLAEVVVGYRMYHIYDRKLFVCVVPAITITVWFIVGLLLIHELTATKSTLKWPTVSFWLGAFDSVYLMAAISYKLWRVHRDTRNAGLHSDGSLILRAMRVLIESAALWAAFAAINYFVCLDEKTKYLAFMLSSMSSPVIGISFCLIIVRLGRTLPDSHEDSWHPSTRAPVSRTCPSGQVAISFPGVGVQQEVCVDESKDFPMESLGSQKQEYVSSSDDLPKV